MIDSWFLSNLVCPVDHQSLRVSGPPSPEGFGGASGALTCEAGHRYPVVDGVPIMLRPDVPQTIVVGGCLVAPGSRSGTGCARAGPLPGITRHQRGRKARSRGAGTHERSDRSRRRLPRRGDQRPDVQAPDRRAEAVPDSRHHRCRLARARRLLDIGCSWGRWTLAAEAKGYEAHRHRSVAWSGDGSPSRRAAARRAESVSRRRCALLAVCPEAFDVTYSVQRAAAHASFRRGSGGRRDGPRLEGRRQRQGADGRPPSASDACITRRGGAFRAASGFEVRYWTIPAPGPAVRTPHRRRPAVDVDCYFGIGLQPSDEPLMTSGLKRMHAGVGASEGGEPPVSALVWVADSVFVESSRA